MEKITSRQKLEKVKRCFSKKIFALIDQARDKLRQEVDELREAQVSNWRWWYGLPGVCIMCMVCFGWYTFI